MSFDLRGKIVIEDHATSAFRRITSGMSALRSEITRTSGASAALTSSAARITTSYSRAATASSALTSATGRATTSYLRVTPAASQAARATEAIGSASTRAATLVGGLASAVGVTTRSAYQAVTGMRGLVGAVAAVGTAYLGAKSAAAVFDKTIGEAARAEAMQTTITGLFKGDYDSASKYFDYINQRAAVSQFSSAEFMEASKTFVIMSKTQSELEKLTDISERLAIMDPLQGFSGAAVALRELQSGDIISLAERFEMPKKTLNEIKNLPLMDQLNALDKELSSYGITQELIYSQGLTALGLYNKSVDKLRMSFRDMGVKSLEHLKPVLTSFNAFLDGDKFKTWVTAGSNAITGFVRGSISAFDRVKNYAASITSNPAFMELQNIEAKIKFVFDDLGDRFGKWWASGGEATVIDMVSKMTSKSAAVLEAAAPLFVQVGTNLGKGIAEGLWTGITSSKAFKWLSMSDHKEEYGEWVPPIRQFTSDKFGILTPSQTERALANSDGDASTNGSIRGNFRSGIDYVPTNRVSQLHAGEAVLNRREAELWRSTRDTARLPSAGPSGATPRQVTLNLNVNNPVVRNDTDINRIALELYALIKQADDAMGGVTVGG